MNELEALREEVAQLRAALYGEMDAQALARVSITLGLTPQQTKLVACLWAHRGEMVRLQTLYDLLDEECVTEVANLIKVIVNRVRGKGLEVVTHWGQGYSLAAASLPVVARAFLAHEDPPLLAYVAEPRSAAEVGAQMGWTAHQAGRRLSWLQRQRLVIQRADMRWVGCAPAVTVGLAE